MNREGPRRGGDDLHLNCSVTVSLDEPKKSVKILSSVLMAEIPTQDLPITWMAYTSGSSVMFGWPQPNFTVPVQSSGPVDYVYR